MKNIEFCDMCGEAFLASILVDDTSEADFEDWKGDKVELGGVPSFAGGPTCNECMDRFDKWEKPNLRKYTIYKGDNIYFGD